MRDPDEMESSGSGMLEDTNASLTCAARTINIASALPPPIFITSRVLQALCVSLIVMFGLVLNFMVLYLVVKYKKLQTLSFAIAIQIAIANLIISIAYGLPSIVNNIAGHWILGLEICSLSSFFGFLVINLRTQLIFIFSLDRFVSVFSPFAYPKYNLRIVVILCIMAWTVSTALSLVAIPQLLDCYIFSQSSMVCAFSSRCSTTCRLFFTILVVTIAIPTTTIPIGFFLALYVKGRKIRRNEAKLRALSDNEVSDWRAIKTFSLLFVAIFAVRVPPIVTTQVSALFGNVVRTLLLTLSSGMSFVLVITDPIMILRNKDAREILSEMKKRWKDATISMAANKKIAANTKDTNQGIELEERQ